MARILKTKVVTDGEKIFLPGDMDGKAVKKSKLEYIQEFVADWGFVYIEQPESGLSTKKRLGFNSFEKACLRLWPIRMDAFKQSIGYPSIQDSVLESPIATKILYQTGDNSHKYGVRLESGVCLYVDLETFDKLGEMETEHKNL